jgi:hypothetical protein
MQKELRENKSKFRGYLLQKKTLESSSKNIINSILTFEPKEKADHILLVLIGIKQICYSL